MSVSYTHLDVYKRQLVERMSVSCEEVTVEAGWERISNPVSVSAAPSDI